MWKRFIWLVIVSWLGFGVFYEGFWFFNLRLNGVYADAEVLDMMKGTARSGGRAGQSAQVLVRFETSEGEFRRTVFRDGEFSSVEKGEVVGVYYDPADPSEIIPDTWTHLIFAAIYIAFIGACALAYIAF